MLRDTLASIAACDPPPAEVLVVDQSGSNESGEVVAACGLQGARVIASGGRGRGLAVNEGLTEAAHDLVFVVDDDCTVRSDWIAAGSAAMAAVPGGIVSGRVLPAGPDPESVPSTIILETPRDYTGAPYTGVLYAGNMVCSRSGILAFGGFDAKIVPSAEDTDLCYRWLKAGRRLQHRPELVVWHRDWRTRHELERLYVDYYRGLGVFYAKHLRRRDLSMLRFIARDLVIWLRSLALARLRGTPRWADVHRGVPGLVQGLREGWRAYAGGPGRLT